jgi:hypothetical protein
LFFPFGITVDSKGNKFFADAENNAIRVINGGSKIISTVSGQGNEGPGYYGDGSAASLAKLSFPVGVAVDSKDDIYICDYGNSVIRKIFNFNASIGSRNISTIVGNGSRGYSGDGFDAKLAMLDSPVGIAVDSKFNVYFSDVKRNVIRIMNGVSRIISTVCGTGYRGFSGDGFHAQLAKLSSPMGISLGLEGNLFIADTGNHRIRMINTTTKNIFTMAGNGSKGSSGHLFTGTAISGAGKAFEFNAIVNSQTGGDFSGGIYRPYV